MNQIVKTTCIGIAVILALASGGCKSPAQLSPEQARFKQEVLEQVQMLKELLGPVMTKPTGKAVDQALSQYFGKTPWKTIDCDYEVRVVDGQKRYIGGRVHRKDWDGSLPGPDIRLDYSQYGKSFDVLGDGKTYAGRFFNSDGPLVIIGSPIFRGGRCVGAFGIFLPGQCVPHHFGLEQDDILSINYN